MLLTNQDQNIMDVTCKSNKEGCGLFLAAGKDSNNCGFTAAHVFLPSEQHWVFDWIFQQHCLHYCLKM